MTITPELEEQLEALIQSIRTDANPTEPIDVLEILAYCVNQIRIMRQQIRDHTIQLQGVSVDRSVARLRFSPSGTEFKEP